MARNFTSPVGRFVQGDCFEAQTKDQQGNLRVVKTGPNAGQPSPQYFVAVAFAKNDPNWPAFFGEIMAEAAGAWPHLFPQGPHGPCTLPGFATKIVDGDGYDTTGKPNNVKPGFAGAWVVRFATTYAPKVFRPTGGNTWAEIVNPAEVKRGFYIRVSGSMKSNENAQRPGLYMNFNMVELCGYGEEIISGPTAAEAFAQPGALPAGASATPLAPVAMPPGAYAPPPGAPGAPAYAPPPGAPGAPAYAPPPGAPGAPAYAPPPNPAYAPPPGAAPGQQYTGYMAPPGAAPVAPAPAYAPPAPAAPPVRTMLPAANGVTYEQYVAAGWSDAQLIQNGMMAA